jgi:transglutaminase-like putative cysteine protease
VTMRIKIFHQTTYRYASAFKTVIQSLRMTPRDHEGQHVAKWRIELSADGLLRAGEDPLGNLTHALTVQGSLQKPLNELIVSVSGEVITTDTNGLINGTAERFNPEIFLRSTELTQADDAICQFADKVMEGIDYPLTATHKLLEALNNDVKFDIEPTHVATTAAESFAIKKGVCQDMTHILIAACRHRGLPARYVSGYFKRIDGVTDQDAGHAWAEVYLPDLGWVGFDAANGICTTDAHVRVAIGLDYLGAAPVRGSRYGGGSETLDVALHVDAMMSQHQN